MLSLKNARGHRQGCAQQAGGHATAPHPRSTHSERIPEFVGPAAKLCFHPCPIVFVLFSGMFSSHPSYPETHFVTRDDSDTLILLPLLLGAGISGL